MKTEKEIIFNLKRNESTYKLILLNYECALEFLRKSDVKAYNSLQHSFNILDTEYEMNELKVFSDINKKLYLECIKLMSLIGDDFVDTVFIKRIKEDYLSFIKGCSVVSQEDLNKSLTSLKIYLDNAMNSYFSYKEYNEKSKLKMIESMSNTFLQKL